MNTQIMTQARPISTLTIGAVIKRINRKLAHENEMLRTARGNFEPSLGSYYVVDLHTNSIVATHADPEKLARELKVIGSWEKVST